MRTLFRLLICLCCFLPFLATAQGPQLDWAHGVGGIGFDIGRATAIDLQGNAYSAGIFQGTADFDPGPGVVNLTSAGDSDAYVAKYDASGNLLWARSWGGTMVDEAKGVTIDSNGFVYIVGRFFGQADLNPDSTGISLATSAGQGDIFVIKLDPNGNYVWSQAIGGTGADEATAIAEGTGNLYITGYFQGAVDFDASGNAAVSTSVSGTYDAFVMGVDVNGMLLWHRTFGDAGIDYGFAVTPSPNGPFTLGVTGCFQGTLDMDGGPGSLLLTAAPGATAAFVAEIEGFGGSTVWANQIGGVSGYCIGYGIACTTDGTYYLTGGVNGTIDLNSGPGIQNYTSAGGYDVFYQKLDRMGGFVMAGAFGGIGDDYGYAISARHEGAVYIGGGYGGTVDFDASPGGTYNITSFNTTFDAYIERIDTLGNFVWARGLGAGGIDYVFGLSADPNGRVLTTGCFDQICDFDTEAGVYNITSNGNADVFVHMIKQCANDTVTVSLAGCDSLVINGQTYFASGAYQQLLVNSRGCDSLVNLQLNISPSAATALADSSCGPYVWNGQTYSVSGTYSQQFLNMAGCDSTVTLSLVVTTIDTAVTQQGNGQLTSNETGATYQWYDCISQSALSNLTAQTSAFTTSGTYAVIISRDGCTDTSGCHAVTVVGVTPGASINFSIGPNPNDGQFKVWLPDGLATAMIAVHDFTGRKVWEGNCHHGGTITLEAPAGCYLVSLETEDGRISRMLILE